MNIQFSECSTKFDNDFIERALIDIACIESGMLKNNKIYNKKNFFDFSNLKKGIPILVPYIPEILVSSSIFKIGISDYSNVIFGKKSEKYIGTKLSYSTNLFVSNFKIRSTYRIIIDNYVKEILDTKFKISQLRNKYKTIGAFQTRNIPHLGHEKIIEMMLAHCDVVVINPILGPKKPGDLNTERLKFIYDNILKTRFNNRILFIPLRANMFYAGPREALHHTLIREWLGFSHFSVGRDHAGSDDFYKPEEAKNTLKSYQDLFNIKILYHNGAYFCKSCNKIILKGDCKHLASELKEVSGSKLRNCLNNNKTYKYASKDVQDWSKENIKTLY
tara:strand:+ start:221 stop:1216 length:996 start_codon:yes stop_codon:yes gene_type:complete